MNNYDNTDSLFSFLLHIDRNLNSLDMAVKDIKRKVDHIHTSTVKSRNNVTNRVANHTRSKSRKK